ncbi:MAG: VPLPA-CTERM-specific exosortase XrtD [Pseudomonadota bacterium]
MSLSTHENSRPLFRLNAGLIWLSLAAITTIALLWDGLFVFYDVWQMPEYSHGPLIPLLSGLLFLRQLKEHPIDTGAKSGRWTGIPFILLAVFMALVAEPSQIQILAAYAVIPWVAGILLISFGWPTGKQFWPPVLHLIYMLPLPAILQIKLTNSLQLFSSEIGVWFLQLLNVPVFLEGNIIDLGVIRLHVAEACSGLRYLFPILSFSYIFAVLYRGPMWHKAVLLLAAAPITVLMNSVRIAVAGVIANHYGVEWLEGFTHFFEGWVIFLICILLLFALAWLMLRLRPKAERTGLAEALDLNTDGLWEQAKRITLVQPSAALIVATFLSLGGLGALMALPERGLVTVDRDNFSAFPRQLGDWQQVGAHRPLDPQTERILQADDYRSVSMRHVGGGAPVDLFLSWYDDQIDGGVHSPEICLPASGWEIAWLERVDLNTEMLLPDVAEDERFNVNRAIIQQGETRMMVYYWFQQGERRVAWDIGTKLYLMVDALQTGYTGGGMIRLITPIQEGEGEADAEERLRGMLTELIPVLPRFIPEGPEH